MNYFITIGDDAFLYLDDMQYINCLKLDKLKLSIQEGKDVLSGLKGARLIIIKDQHTYSTQNFTYKIIPFI